MPINLGQIRQGINWRIDNTSSAKFWTDAELNYWVNEALRDIARRTETLQMFTTEIQAREGQNKYPLELNALRVHRVEYQPVQGTTANSSPQVYPLELTNEYVMDQVWGSWQQVQRSYPGYAIFWGNPPSLTMQVYPAPAQQGHFNMWYYGLPDAVSKDADVLEVTEGWWDLVEKYVEYVALRKDRDPRWSDAKDIYEADLENLMDKTRFWHDQAGQISPAWMSSPSNLAMGGW